jgi:hypothetical protein
MNKSAPKGGAGSDDPTGLDLCCERQGHPVGHSDRSFVRTSSSNADGNQFSDVGTATVSRSQSERGLDSVSESPKGDLRTRASGKSDGTRSDRSETSCGWRGVAAALHAMEGQRHE